MLKASSNRGQTKVRVWDLPLRVSHWLVVACIASAWLTRDARDVDLHAAAGYCAFFLLAFRLAWGFTGTVHARFRDFAYPPRAALGYLRDSMKGSPQHFTGHNPAGSWSIYVLLAGIALTCITGIIAIGAMFGLGPAPVSLPAAAANALREAHEWLAWTLLAVIGLHVAGAIVSSVLHRENLVAAMVSGRKAAHEANASDVDARAPTGLLLAAAAATFAAAYLHASGWSEGYASQRAAARASRPARDVWMMECGGCHLAYPPSMLPQRSWDRMLQEQADHFGEDLSLRPATVAALLAHARQPRPVPWASARLARSAPPGQAPQRITELRFWRRAHRALPDAAFRPPVSAGKHDCDACHVDAASGIFQPRMIQRPVRESIS